MILWDCSELGVDFGIMMGLFIDDACWRKLGLGLDVFDSMIHGAC